ncbi:MAG: hypothetical protein WA890_17325, partial [Micromonospora sp.]
MRTRTGESLVDRLAGRWRRAGVTDVRVATDLGELAVLAAAATGPVVVSGADLVAHTAVLKHLATSPVGPTVALVLTDCWYRSARCSPAMSQRETVDRPSPGT